MGQGIGSLSTKSHDQPFAQPTQKVPRTKAERDARIDAYVQSRLLEGTQTPQKVAHLEHFRQSAKASMPPDQVAERLDQILEALDKGILSRNYDMASYDRFLQLYPIITPNGTEPSGRPIIEQDAQGRPCSGDPAPRVPVRPSLALRLRPRTTQRNRRSSRPLQGFRRGRTPADECL